MGLFLKKSFRAGPVRLNLSKSGLGVSTGIKGMRLGTGPRGSYVHAGRGGLYYRKSLESGKQRRAETEPGGCLLIIGIIVGLAIISSIIQFFMKNPIVFYLLIGIGAIVSVCIGFYRYLVTSTANKFKKGIDELFFISSDNFSLLRLKELVALKEKYVKINKLKERFIEIEEKAYEAILDKIIDDKKITVEEKYLIDQFESFSTISDDFKRTV